MLLLLTVVVVGFAATFLLTPLTRALACRYKLVDYPDWQRKLHSRPTPLGGGVTVLAGTVVGVTMAFAVPHPWRPMLADGMPHLLALLAAASILCAVGLTDDYVHLRASHKLLGQILAALVVIVAGLQAERVQFICWEWELGLLAIPFTLFWILGAINALNLLDGSDGVATTVGMVISVALAVMSLMLPHREVEAIVALSLSGSLLAFLFFNFPPASIFLGDAGSTIIGLVIGVLALRSGLKGPATIALAAPVAIFAVPIFDTGMAILRRKLAGRSLYAADREHLHHCLLRRGLSSRRTAVCIGILCACTAAAALISVYRRNELLAIIGATAVLAALVLTGFFGHSESRILFRRLARAVRWLWAGSVEVSTGLREDRVHVAGALCPPSDPRSEVNEEAARGFSSSPTFPTLDTAPTADGIVQV